MRSNWSAKKLGEVCDIYQPVTITSKEILEKGPYKVYGANGVIGYYDRYNHEDTEVLVTCRGSTCGTINISEPKSWITGNAMVVHPLSKSLLKEFLFYCLKSTYLLSAITGAAQPQITRHKLSSIEIPLPPLEIQKKIVAKIEELFGKIDKAKELRQKAVEKTEQIFPSALQKVFSQVEKKWGAKKIRDICDKIKQSHPRNIFETTFRYIDITSIDTALKLIKDTKTILVNEAPHRARKLVKEGDTIFATTRPYLKNIAYISEDFNNCVASTGFCVIRPNGTILNSTYVFHFINSDYFISQILPYQHGASYPAVSDNNVSNCNIPLPPIPEQKRIVEYLDALREKVDKLKQLQQDQLSELKELKNSILDKAFKGELVK